MERLAPADFRPFVELNAGLERTVPDVERRAALASIVEAAGALVGGEPQVLFADLPRTIAQTMGPFGWLWNGFYVVRRDERDKLHLGPACGPPVCTPIERHGGPLTSGMCFDALHLNQTMAAYETKRWPGYVSCDAESGLSTVSGIVCPIRNPDGIPIAVWDLDATETIEPGDVRTMDVLFATLARCVAIEEGSFEGR